MVIAIPGEVLPAALLDIFASDHLHTPRVMSVARLATLSCIAVNFLLTHERCDASLSPGSVTEGEAVVRDGTAIRNLARTQAFAGLTICQLKVKNSPENQIHRA